MSKKYKLSDITKGKKTINFDTFNPNFDIITQSGKIYYKKKNDNDWTLITDQNVFEQVKEHILSQDKDYLASYGISPSDFIQKAKPWDVSIDPNPRTAKKRNIKSWDVSLDPYINTAKEPVVSKPKERKSPEFKLDLKEPFKFNVEFSEPINQKVKLPYAVEVQQPIEAKVDNTQVNTQTNIPIIENTNQFGLKSLKQKNNHSTYQMPQFSVNTPSWDYSYEIDDTPTTKTKIVPIVPIVNEDSDKKDYPTDSINIPQFNYQIPVWNHPYKDIRIEPNERRRFYGRNLKNNKSLRSYIADALKYIPFEEEFKQDAILALQAPTAQDTYDMALNKLSDKLDINFHTINENTSGDIVKIKYPFGDEYIRVPDNKFNYEQFIQDFKEASKQYEQEWIDKYGPKTTIRERMPGNLRGSKRHLQHWYMSNEDINLNQVSLGYRNRNKKYDEYGNIVDNTFDNTPIKSKGVIITSNEVFLPYGSYALSPGHNYALHQGQGSDWNYYYGIRNGKFIFGDDYSKFQKGDILTKTYGKKVSKLIDNGVDGFNLILSDGSLSSTNITSSNSKVQPYHRGRTILIADNEARLVSGSFEHINKVFEDMKKRHNTKYITLVELDNGSFSEGLRTDSGEINSNDWDTFFKQNDLNGHNLYLQ